MFLSRIGVSLRNIGTFSGDIVRNSPRLIFHKTHATSTEKNDKLHIHAHSERLTPLNSKEGYQVVYRFKHIIGIRALSRLKIYQTVITVSLIPINQYLYTYNLISWNTCLSSFSISVFASVMLYIMNHISQKVVGLMAVNEDRSTVRLSHLTFLGKRRDIFVPLEDIIPFNDMGENLDDLYTKIKRFSDPKFVFYLPMRHGLIENDDVFQMIFGSKI